MLGSNTQLGDAGVALDRGGKVSSYVVLDLGLAIGRVSQG